MLNSSKDLVNISAYQVEYEERLDDLKSTGVVLTHRKTGAKVCLISNEDENKVFYIGFRTPSIDSTGSAHIVEHSVLCGSRKYPAKDPFNELLKGSLNTFLNAMTYPDKTMYPVASCNDKDFQNLMDVYMDAVLYPNIYDEEKIFKQEAWRYELEDADAPITMNGIVYSEMKGAFSQPEQTIYREIMHTLFPDTGYGFESGGHPDVIPTLSYKMFLEFHGRYYHPTNSYIYLYGNCDMAEKLNWLDSEYLSAFDKIDIDSEVKLQQAFVKKDVDSETSQQGTSGGKGVDSVSSQQGAFTGKRFDISYPIGDEEDDKDKTFYAYNIVAGETSDVRLTVALSILSEVLINAPGAPIKQALLDKGIGQDVFAIVDEVRQPFFAVIAKNADAGLEAAFVDTIRSTLADLVKDGLNENSLLAAINRAEFKYREADYGRIPKGLMTGIILQTSWLYDDRNAFAYLHGNDYYAKLKGEIKTGYFENILKEYMLESGHMTVVTLSPKKGLTSENEAKLGKKLQDYKLSLSKSEIDALIDDTQKLKAYQLEPSTKEDIDKIPKLTIADVKKEALKLTVEESTVHDIPALFHKLNTNGIAYILGMFDLSGIKEEYVPYVGLLTTVFAYVNTKKRSFLELSNEINIHTGGIGASLDFLVRKDKNDYVPTFNIDASVLYGELPTAIELLNEVIHESVMEDSKRLYEILAETKSRMQMSMSGGAVSAIHRATSYYSQMGCYYERSEGIDYYNFICGLLDNFEEKKQEIFDALKLVSDSIYTRGNLLIDVIVEEGAIGHATDALRPFIEGLGDGGTDNFANAAKKGSVANWSGCEYDFKPEKKHEGFYYAGQVQYVARAGNFIDGGFKPEGGLLVLKSILSREYLWNNIRVLGGAYGCFLSLSMVTGNASVCSYRDPNLRETDEIFVRMSEYVANLDLDDDEMTKFIIGTMSGIDIPLTPKMEGGHSLDAYLGSVTYEDIQKERDEVLSTDIKKIRELSNVIECFIEQGNFCVIGNEGKIKENKELFKEVKSLF